MTDIFKQNISTLDIRSPDMAEMLKNTAPSKTLQVSYAKNGLLTAKTENLWLHSKYDPEAEAQKIAQEAISSGAELIVLYGLGLGYIAQAILNTGNQVLIVETEASWLAALLHAIDLSHILQADNCNIILCPQGDGILNYLDELSPKSIYTLEAHYFYAMFKKDTENLRLQVQKYKQKDEINAATLKRFGKLWVKNIAKNLRTSASMPSLKSFEHRLDNFPALVVAAGPSLDDACHILPMLKERMVIIAVDTALRTMLKYGVEPDFVVAVDPQYWNCRHLDNCSTTKTILISEVAVWPSLLRLKTRCTLLCSSLYPLGLYIDKELGLDRGKLGAGGSVATSAWDLARILGAESIYMLGLDLSFPMGLSHAKYSRFEQWALQSGSRLEPASTEAFKAILTGKPFKAESNSGESVTSDERLALYASWFTRKCANPKVKTYNLSLTGLKIQAMPYFNADLLNTLPVIRPLINKALEAAIKDLPCEQKHEKLAELLQKLLAAMTEILELADKGLEYSEMALQNNNLEFALSELEHIDSAILNSHVKDVAGFIIPETRNIASTKAKDMAEIMQHSAMLYKTIANSAKWHIKILSACNID